MIKSSRVFLHSDFIDINAKAKEITQELKDKKLNSLSRAFGINRQTAPKPPQQTNPKLEQARAKEREAYEKYFKDRELRVEKMAQSRGKSMLAGIQCAETRHLLRGGEEEAPKKRTTDSSDEELEIEGFGKTSGG